MTRQKATLAVAFLCPPSTVCGWIFLYYEKLSGRRYAVRRYSGEVVFSNILVVCVGNICRSPMAACLLRERLAGKGLAVQSAGLGALVDQPMDPLAAEVLASHGFSDPSHRARQLERRHLQEADLVLVAEKKMIDAVLRIGPEARGKVFALGKWQSDRDIPDPYRQSRAIFEHTYALVDEAVNAWIRQLG